MMLREETAQFERPSILCVCIITYYMSYRLNVDARQPMKLRMIFKIIIAYLILPLIAASLKKVGNADPNSGVPASAKSLHLSVTTGTPGVWYPGTGAPFNSKSLFTYWTASDSSGQFPSAASENGTVYVSDDYGVTWSGRGASRAHTSITSDATGNRLAVTVNNEGVYLSSDRGITWTLANITGASSSIWADVASDFSGQHLTAISSNYGFIHFSHDYGATWTSTSSPCQYFQNTPSVTISHDGQYQFATFEWCSARSTDYGATWTQMSTYTRSIACSANGQRVAATSGYNGEQIMGSTDYGVTWTQFNHPTGSMASFFSIVMDTSGHNIVVGVLSVKAVRASADGGATWSYITPPGGDFATTWPWRMVGDAAAKHLLIAQELKTTVNPLVTASLPESVPTAKPTGHAPLGFDSSNNRTVKSFASVKDAQFFLVPANVTSIKVTLYAASGSNYTSPWSHQYQGIPGNGGMISSFVPVTPGEVLMVMVGSAGTGDDVGGGGEGGFNGGGDGNGGGGGATDIRRSPYALTDRVLIAGAGGGGYYEDGSLGGDGGLNPTGGTPTQANYLQDHYAAPGGTHLQGPTCTNNNPGPLGQGCDAYYGTGGGGGYYGGAPGYYAGGGGGSSFSLYPIVIEATGVNTGDGYAVLEYTPDLAASPTAAPSLFPVPSPTAQSGVCPRGTILLSNQCAVCPAGTYAGPGFAQCMPCPAGTYSGAWSATCQVSPAGFFSLGGAAQASMCPAGTVSTAGASSCTACSVGQYSYPGTSSCLSCASSA